MLTKTDLQDVKNTEYLGDLTWMGETYYENYKKKFVVLEWSHFLEKVACSFHEKWLKVKVMQPRYRPGLAQRIP